MRILSLCPRVRKEDERLVIRTSWFARLLSLGLLDKSVVVDPSRKRLSITRRVAWVRRRRRVPFSQVVAVTYGYEDLAFASLYAYAHGGVDSFSVGVRLVDDSEIHFFRFVGDGTFTNNGPLPDWLYWGEYAFDVSGTQVGESRALVDLLSSMLGVTVVPSHGG